MTEAAGAWGRLATCGGLVTRLPTFANGRQAPVDNRRAGYHPAPPSPYAAVTHNRSMPPWLPGEPHFKDERRLSDAEIATLARWPAHGAPEGNLAAAPAPHPCACPLGPTW